MGWLWLVGSLQLQVSFAKEPYKWDYILQKRPIIFRSHMNTKKSHTNECHVCMRKYVMSRRIVSFHIWRSQVTREWNKSCFCLFFFWGVNESCHDELCHVTYAWVMSYVDKESDMWRHESCRVTFLIHMSFLIHIWLDPWSVTWHVWCLFLTFFIHLWRSHVWRHESCRVTILIHMTFRIHIWLDPWLVTWHDWCLSMTVLIHIWRSHIWRHESCHVCMRPWVMPHRNRI